MGNTTYALPQYEWFIVVGSFAAIAFGYATGSNDVANAFATSVGSRALTMRQAVVIASIFEFAGGILLGRVSTSVIATGVSDVNDFATAPYGPESYAYGMVVALAVGGLWQLWASWAGYNVSATQSIIGAIIGFSLVWGGVDAVKWAVHDDSKFPPVSGVLPIVLAWFIAPVLTGCAASLLFWVLRTVVLRSSSPVNRALFVLPIAVLLTAWVNTYFVLTKGAEKLIKESQPDWNDTTSAWVSCIVAGVCTLFAIWPGMMLMKKKVESADFQDNDSMAKIEKGGANEAGGEMDAPATTVSSARDPASSAAPVDKPEPTGWRKYASDAKSALSKGTTYDIHAVVEDDPFIQELHMRAEKFDPRAERVFSILQIFSAICVIFAHGASEVGYMAGPLTQVYYIVRDGYLTTSSFEPLLWVLVLGAGSLVLGLATYGYNVMQAMGCQMAKLTPSRGFSAELATSFVIMIASQYGLPVSSSQCITGGIMGVGILEGINGVNWKWCFQQLLTWIGTLVVVGLISAAIFAQAIYTPSQNCDVGNPPLLAPVD